MFAKALVLALLCGVPFELAAQKIPDTVLLEELTWDEVRDLIKAGKTSIIIPTAGQEQKGPHMAGGEHKFVIEYTSEQIARKLGNALVAPVITYVPEGSWEPPRGHMTKAGTITLPDDRFRELLEHAARSLKAGGFTDIIYLGDSGGNQNGMRDVAAKLTAEWQGTGFRVHFIPDYYTKTGADVLKYITETLKERETSIGGHAGMVDTSELMYVRPDLVRLHKRALNGGFPDSGVSGDPTKASAELGQKITQIKIDNSVAQIRASVPASPGLGPMARTEPRRPATPSSPQSIMMEELPWDEVRDAIKGGKTTIIVPIGGTEQNGPHMVLGKHNYIVTFAARQIAQKLGNALVAPTIQYVPEGNYNSANFGAKPGVISNPSPSYENLLDAAARSLKVHGFTDILFIGDSGGNQNGMTAVADKLNAEWQGSGARVYALTDYYRKSREELRAWLLKQHNYDNATVGSHAGISDTSQLLHVFPAGIRKDKIKPSGGGPDSGVNGDPTKATAEIGKKSIELKVNAAIEQFRVLKGR